MATPPVSATQSTAFTPLPPHTTGNDGGNVSLIVGVGVAGTALVLLTVAVIIIITVLVCRRKNRFNITGNVAYQSSTSEVKLSPNVAYHSLTPSSSAQEHITNTISAIHVTTSTIKR